MMNKHCLYPAYKPSGVPWLDDMPEHWDVRRAGWLFRKMDRAVRDGDEVITCFRDGTVTLRKNRRTEGFITESLKEIGYQGVRRGDLVIHQMDAFAGAVGVSDSDGKGTPVYSVCHPNQDADPFYYAHIVREMARSQWILALAKGIRERSTDLGTQSSPINISPSRPSESSTPSSATWTTPTGASAATSSPSGSSSLCWKRKSRQSSTGPSPAA